MRTSLILTSVFILIASSLTTGCGASAAPPMAEAPRATVSAGAAAYPQAVPSMESPAMPAQMSAAAPTPARPGAPTPAPSPPPGGVTAKADATTGHAPSKGKETAPETATTAGIIYTGNVGIRAKREEFAKTIDRVVDLAESLGGALTGRTNESVTIRVPSQSFRKAMSGMEEVGVVENRNVSAQDVSEEMHDLEVRLQNMRATRKRLEEFLAKATNITDTLAVEHELERVAVEIDRIEGRLAFLKAHTAYSHITVNLLEKPKENIPVVVTPPPPPPPPARKLVDVPASWIDSVGIDPLLKVH